MQSNGTRNRDQKINVCKINLGTGKIERMFGNYTEMAKRERDKFNCVFGWNVCKRYTNDHSEVKIVCDLF